jgi:carbon storage regulator CsrA
MLVLSRRPEEMIVLPTVPAVIKVIASQHGAVRLGIEAPSDVPVLRHELYESGPGAAATPAGEPAPATLPGGIKARVNGLAARTALLRMRLERADPGVRRQVEGLEQEVQALRRLLAGSEEDLPESEAAVG